uniref:C2H2-type domain-containing protein n=1 Tax=Mesocestoides corti TaxID=53468 RepID=A0A5K3F396_MESCO
MELIAAHLRLHTELRCCEKCATVLPNSALAVDAPDAQQHRCSNLVTARHAGHSAESQSSRFTHDNAYTGRPCKRPLSRSDATWKPFCEPCDTEFNSVIQYQQHLKNVHNKNRFVCPECNTTFSTKGNMTTHFQRVHNQSDSVVCPVCSKRMSSQFNLDRHIRLVHATSRSTANATLTATSATGRQDFDQLKTGHTPKRGYLLYMASSKPLEHPSSLIVDDVSVDQQQGQHSNCSSTVGVPLDEYPKRQ